MSYERWLFGRVLYPAYHAAARDDVMRHIETLERNQWLGPSELQALQAEKLDRLMRHAARHVPYYRPFLEGIEGRGFSMAELQRLPPLTKATIRSAGRNLIAANAQPRDLKANSTSGSTGEPLYFYTDERSASCRKASVVRNKRWTGLEPGDRQLVLWGSPVDTAKSQQLRGKVHSWLTRSRLVSAYDLSRDKLEDCLREIESYRPRLLVAYPSVLEELAQQVQRSARGTIRLPAVLTSAETLYPHQRALFEQVFATPVFNRYGCREVGDIAQECAVHDGLHINSDRVLVEIVREDGSWCEPGELGDVLVTDLDNYGMPLIRYAIGDRAALAPATPCSCGRGLQRLALVEGRTLDVVRFPNGSAVGGTYWTILLRKRPGIDQFQVVQKALDELVIRYIAAAPLSAETAEFVRNDVLQRAGAGFRVVFERVDRIAVTAGGKRRIVISDLTGAGAKLASAGQARSAPKLTRNA
jgi:phenylacetate-CoA ligase